MTAGLDVREDPDVAMTHGMMNEVHVRKREERKGEEPILRMLRW